MATDILTPRAEKRDASPLLGVLPYLSCLALFVGIVVAGYWGILTILTNEVSPTLERHFVFRRLEDPLYLGNRYPFWRGIGTVALLVVGALVAGRFVLARRAAKAREEGTRWLNAVYGVTLGCLLYLTLALWFLLHAGGSGYQWLHVLIPVLIAGFFYVAWMYSRDSGAIAAPWAVFLAGLRVVVYTALAIVFLLPAWQNWEKTETRSKVVALFDVSASMGNRDDLPTESMPPEKAPTRQDKVIRFLTDDQVAFLQAIQKKNPISLYRFGGALDDKPQPLEGDKALDTGEWTEWLKLKPAAAMPEGLTDEQKATWRARHELEQQLVQATNVGEALVGVLNREANNMLQGIIIFSDGRSTKYSAQLLEEARNRAKKAKTPIFTVAVGEHRQPIHIRITDVQAPEQARPDDKFPVRVEVDGDGLPEKETKVFLDITTPKGEKKTLERALKFGPGAGGPPHAQAEFDIDPAELGGPGMDGKAPELEEGEWRFQARVPRDKQEMFLEAMHLSENKPTVQVVKKPIRVLLFGEVASKDFQFIRNLFVREVDRKRAELSIYLQMLREGVVQDVPAERLLRQFPGQLVSEDSAQVKPEDKYLNLGQYDLIVAVDPDWTRLSAEQLALVEKWVGTHAGGLVLVAGPVNTYQLARPGNRDRLKPLLDVYPVILQDARLHGLGLDRPTTEPWRLNFPGATAEMEFLKLDDEGKDPLAGWEEFFTGQVKADPGKRGEVRRGFYNYYPLDGVKPSATVVATFADPRARLTSGGEQPYLVTMPYGNGRVLYLGSGESWRLRMCREVFQERFWTKLARYAGSGNLTRLSRRGVLVMGREFTTGQFVRIEAQLFGRDLQPLGKTFTPKLQIKPPTGVTAIPTVAMGPKPSQAAGWQGWFQGRFPVQQAGEYRVELTLPETGDILTGKFMVREANPELENPLPDFAQLYQLASDASEALPRASDKQIQAEIARSLQAAAARVKRSEEEKGKGDVRGSTTAKSSGVQRDSANGEELRLFFDLSSARLIPQCLTEDSRLLKSRGPFEDLWDRGFTLSSQGWFGSEGPMRMSSVLLAVVGLLSLEWLTRKLLKLA